MVLFSGLKFQFTPEFIRLDATRMGHEWCMILGCFITPVKVRGSRTGLHLVASERHVYHRGTSRP